MAHERAPDRSILFEGGRNWLTKIVVRFLLDFMKRKTPSQWKRLVWTLKKNPVESRVAILASGEITDRIFHLLPITKLPILSEWFREMLELLPEAFASYAQDQDLPVPDSFQPSEADVKDWFADFFKELRSTIGEWQDNLSQMIMDFLPFLRRFEHEYDEHLLILSSIDMELFYRWSSWLAILKDDDLAVVQRVLHTMTNPRLLGRIMDIPMGVRMSFIRAYAGKHFGDHVSETIDGVSRTVRPTLLMYSRQRRINNTRLDERKHELMRKLGMRR